MQYAVTMKYVDPGPLLPMAQVMEMVENAILPSFDQLDQLLANKKVLAGGVVAGARAIRMIVEAASNEEVSDLLHGLPFWRLVKTKITPLESFSHRLQAERAMIQQMKQAAG